MMVMKKVCQFLHYIVFLDRVVTYVVDVQPTFQAYMSLFDTLADCCKNYYAYDLRSCLKSDPSYVDPTDFLYYPNWETGICVRDGQAPAYIRNQQTLWMFGKFINLYVVISVIAQSNLLTITATDNLVDCCKQYHSYNYNACISSAGAVVADPTATLYYPDWENYSGCVVGGAPDYMKLNPDQWMFTTLAECCETHYPWLVECDPSNSKLSNKWCMNWNQNKCAQECNAWDYTYDTQSECCDQR
jgi:hypothetical protein